MDALVREYGDREAAAQGIRGEVLGFCEERYPEVAGSSAAAIGQAISASGRTLATECAVCHTMPQRGPLLPIEAEVPVSDAPWRPWELVGRHQEVLCSRWSGARPATSGRGVARRRRPPGRLLHRLPPGP